MERWEYLILSFIALGSIVLGALYTSLPFTEFLVERGTEAARLALIMAWETWWALVLGFSIAGGVEAWLSREAISSRLEGSGPREIALGSFFGFVSSSCSYSAIATAKNLFRKGASAAASLGAFMFASTNLVIEIGIVMYILLGWQFLLADIVGGGILIALMALGFNYLVPDKVIEEARENALGVEKATDPVCGMEVEIEEAETLEHEGHEYHFCCSHCMESFDPEEHGRRSLKENITSREGWKMLADKQWSEWMMLWEDILVGFVLAGIIGAFIPNSVWGVLFGEQAFLPLYILLMAIVGTLIGVATFVCSVGNVPFAAILWNRGLPFGGVLSYIYADLIVPPIMDAYRKYYGWRFAALLSGMIFATAVLTGVIIHFLFLQLGLIPSGKLQVVERSIEFNYKAWLNLFFTAVFLGLYWLHRKG